MGGCRLMRGKRDASGRRGRKPLEVQGAEEAAATAAEGKADAAALAGPSSTGRAALLAGLFALCWGWWSSFHDVSALSVPPFPLLAQADPASFTAGFTMRDLSCITGTAGTCIGFLAAWRFSLRRAEGAPFATAVVPVLAATGIGYYLCLFRGIMVGIFAFQFLFCVVAPFLLVTLLGLLFSLARERLLPCLAAATLGSAAVKSALFLATLPSGFGVGALAASVAVAVAACTLSFLWLRNVASPSAAANRERRSEEGRRAWLLGDGLWTPLLHVALFGAVFGIIHTFPTGSGHTPELRTLCHLAGTAIACLWFAVAFRPSKGTASLVRIWHFTTKATFPVIMMGLFLMPLIMTDAYTVPEILSQVGLALYTLSLFAAFALVARHTGLSPFVICALCLFVYYAGQVVGLLSPLLLHGAMPFDSTAFTIVASGAFLLLVIAMFEIPIMTGMRTYWGLEEKTSPKGHFDDRLRRRCREIAGDHKLTKREEEILFRVLQGQRPSTIAEELVISINTTRTHIQRIYAKTGVHSESELLSLARDASPKA